MDKDLEVTNNLNSEISLLKDKDFLDKINNSNNPQCLEEVLKSSSSQCLEATKHHLEELRNLNKMREECLDRVKWEPVNLGVDYSEVSVLSFNYI